MAPEELAQLENNFSTFRDMIAEIFSVQSAESSFSFANPSSLLFEFSNRIIVTYNKFTGSDLYSFFVGIALIGLMVYFVIQTFEENEIYRESSLTSQRMIRKYFKFICALFLIFFMRSIIYYILALFRFVLYFAVDITESSFNSLVSAGKAIDVTSFDTDTANLIAYKILDKEKVFNGTALIDETIARSKEAGLRNLYFVPWLISWISKLGIVVVTMVNAVNLLIHCSVYVISISDIIISLKKSRFLNFTKEIIALAFQLTVIVLVLYFFKLVCNPYLQKLLDEVLSGDGNYLSLAIIFSAVESAKFMALIGTYIVSKRTFGVK